ncbi:lon protease homolog, mitochondrial-like [Rutidosis leptorrhynchoides]|uniref:lon protease homolog, mitochondrial-like n=1 Tax=Rutidosis leptorrhynchoides TaxID=125765 RepID=UPI003A9966B6
MMTRTLWTGRVESYNLRFGKFNYSRLADIAAAISHSDKLQCQQVLEKLHVYKRLRLSLGLLKNQMEMHKIQKLELETYDKTALIEKFRVRIYANEVELPHYVLQVIEEEMKKLQLLEGSSWGFNVTQRYLDDLIGY